jgi:hypothetical protein
MASFLPGPEEGSVPFVDGLNNPSKKKSNSHSVGEHGRKNRVNEDQTSPDGEAPTTPTR